MTMELLQWQQRVLTERNELIGRLVSLAVFLSAPPANGGLPPSERLRLVRQRDLMQQYLDVLNERVDSWIKDFA